MTDNEARADARNSIPEQSVWLASGFALDAVGAHESIQLRRNQVPQLESDHDYRNRIIARLRGESKPTYSDWVEGTDAPLVRAD